MASPILFPVSSVKQDIRHTVKTPASLFCPPPPQEPHIPCIHCMSGLRFFLPRHTSFGERKTARSHTLEAEAPLDRNYLACVPNSPNLAPTNSQGRQSIQMPPHPHSDPDPGSPANIQSLSGEGTSSIDHPGTVAKTLKKNSLNHDHREKLGDQWVSLTDSLTGHRGTGCQGSS